MNNWTGQEPSSFYSGYPWYTQQQQPRNLIGPINYTDNSGWNQKPMPNFYEGAIPAWFVNSEEEALSKHLEPGMKAIFMDISKPLLYVRKINENGIPEPIYRMQYSDYVRSEPVPAPQIDTSSFVKKEDLEKFKQEIVDLLK